METVWIDCSKYSQASFRVPSYFTDTELTFAGCYWWYNIGSKCVLEQGYEGCAITCREVVPE